MRHTPECIENLQANEIFVFGSNLNGNHAGGAARIAVEKFGAIEGQAEGIQGQSYAIPTLSEKMDKLSLETIEVSVAKLLHYASENIGMTFFVTKIGCGIAGFKISEIAAIFYDKAIPANVVLPQEFSVTKSYKGFDKDLKCRDFQYEIGGTYQQEAPPQVCGSGFHSCQHPLDVLSFYSNTNGNRYCAVSNFGALSKSLDGDTKIASSQIKIDAEIGIVGLIKGAVSFVRKSLKIATPNDNIASTTGNDAHSATTGNDCISFAAGISSKAKAAIGSWIVLAEWRQDDMGAWHINSVKSAQVDGDKIKGDTYYFLQYGDFVEAE